MDSLNTNHLKELRPESGVKVQQSIVEGFHQMSNRSFESGTTLVEPKLVANGVWRRVLTQEAKNLLSKGTHLKWKSVMQFPEVGSLGFMESLNTSLRGGTSYPVLSFLTSTAIGVASSGIGLLFSATSTVVSMSQKSNNVLARPGDQIWKVEEIGKVLSEGKSVPTYVLSFFIIDPFRDFSRFKSRGWLIHEQRYEIHES